ncbi:hypothetical protein ACFRAQ_34765 [Nocardia sp. NPDC056611]|uniref:hypothetical protein n=1 Tax=Nocardia sp. NPDC056611 TaxID=3345877 RepID=UPI00366E24D6
MKVWESAEARAAAQKLLDAEAGLDEVRAVEPERDEFGNQIDEATWLRWFDGPYADARRVRDDVLTHLNKTLGLSTVGGRWPLRGAWWTVPVAKAIVGTANAEEQSIAQLFFDEKFGKG